MLHALAIEARPRLLALFFTLVIGIALGTAIHMGFRSANAEEDHAAAQRAFLDEASRQQLPTGIAGRVIHVQMREYSRQAPDTAGGPPHLDPRWLIPETTVREIWAVVDGQGFVANAANYARDEFGNLIGQSTLNEQGNMTVYEARVGRLPR